MTIAEATNGFAFDRDFVFRTCLALLGEGARKAGVRERIEEKWER
jgi:hypothetical protein